MAGKKETHKLGDVWDVPQGSFVQRPDGVVVNVGQGGHVLDVEGEYVCGDETVTAK